MPIYTEAGARLTAAAVVKTAVVVADPTFAITNRVFEDQPLHGADTPGRRVKWHAGQVIPTSEFNAAFQIPTIASITPATGPAAGGTVVTIRGTDLNMVTAVTFGGTPGTALTVTATTAKVTAPAHAVGAVAVALSHDSGADVTQAAGFSFT